jgi:hypothetical protein
MQFYENLAPEERRRIVLGAVAFSAAMEGMSEAYKTCCKELEKDTGKFQVIKRSNN